MKLRRLLSSAAIVASSTAALNVVMPAAQAYTLTPNGRTAGNPEGQLLYDIHIDSNDAIEQKRLDTTTFELNRGTQNTDGDGLTKNILGTAVMTVMDLTPDSLSLNFKFRNKTDKSYQAAITGLWFGVKENITDISITGSNYFNKIAQPTNGNAPGGFKDIDVCVFASSNCSGGDIKEGLQVGQTDWFTVKLTGDFDSNDDGFAEATISDLGVKWQTQDGSYAVTGVPEPLTILGSTMAAGFGVMMKRGSSQRKRQSKEKATA